MSKAFNLLSRILRDIFCLPLPSHADLGDRPILRIFKVILLIATYRDTHTSISILFVAIVGLVSSLVRYELIQTLSTDNYTHVLYFIIWICVLISSISCCWLYVHIFVLMVKTYRSVWQQSVAQQGLSRTLTKLLVCAILGFIAIFKLHSDMSLWRETIQELKLPALWFYYLLWFFRLLQRSLACCFITLVLPVTQTWLIHAPHEVKGLLVQLVPWQIFHTFQRILLRLTLVSVAEYWSVYGGIWFILSWCFKLWPLFLAFTVANTYIFPILYTPKDDEKKTQKETETKTNGNENENENKNEDDNEASDSENNTPKIMVTGLTKPIVEYPEKAELVNANVFERYNYFLHPLQGNPTRHTSQRAQLDTLYNTQPYEVQDVVQVTPEVILSEEPAVNLEGELPAQLESDTDKVEDEIDEIPFIESLLRPEKDLPIDTHSTQDSPLASDEYNQMATEVLPTESITSGLRRRQNIRSQIIDEEERNLSSTELPVLQEYQMEAVDVEQGSSRQPKQYIIGSSGDTSV